MCPVDPPLLRILIATTNRGKQQEIVSILSRVRIGLAVLDEFPAVPSPEETGATFEENARLKARYYSRATGLPAVAEDSGLMIDWLDDEPGIYSARYGGTAAADYSSKFALIYQKLRERRLDTSPARFICALTVASGDRIVFETQGIVEGTIAPAPRGTGGFGYDPIFYFPPYARTLAEVSGEEKDAVSHRGRAFRKLRQYLEGEGLTRGA